MSLARDRTPAQAALALCALAALGAWAACVVACGSRPSWSPDGTKVVFAYRRSTGTADGEPAQPGSVALAVHDLRTGETRALLDLPMPQGQRKDEISGVPVFTRWLSGGRRLLIVFGDTEGGDHHVVSVLDAQSTARLKRFEVGSRPGGPADVTVSFFPPAVDADRWVFFGGESVTRLDLESGEIERRRTEFKEGPYLFEAGDAIFYFGTKRRENETFSEIGTFDAQSFAFTPRLDLSEAGVAKKESAPTATRDGKQVALIAARGGEKEALFVFEGSKLEKTVALEHPGKGIHFAKLAWSSDGATIYGAYGVENEQDIELGVAEFPLAAGQPSYRKLCAARKGQNADQALFHFQLALSPDAKTLAVSSALFPPKALREEDRVLFLVDLTRPDRPVTRVRPPAAPATPARAEPERPK
jgi:hypothetical protein